MAREQIKCPGLAVEPSIN